MPCVGQNKLVYTTQELPSTTTLAFGDSFIIETLDGPYKVDFSDFIIDINQTTFAGAFYKHGTDIQELSANTEPELFNEYYNLFQQQAGVGLAYITSLRNQLESIVSSLSSSYETLKTRYKTYLNSN